MTNVVAIVTLLIHYRTVMPTICHTDQQHLMEENSDLQRQLKEAKDIVKLTETVIPSSLYPSSLLLALLST